MKNPYERKVMNAKKKFEDVKVRFIQLMQERPLETIAVISAAAMAAAKILNSFTEARNSSTWKREVKRREQSQQKRYSR